MDTLAGAQHRKGDDRGAVFEFPSRSPPTFGDLPAELVAEHDRCVAADRMLIADSAHRFIQLVGMVLGVQVRPANATPKDVE